MRKFVTFYNDLLFVSKVTDTKNKKIRILFSVFASNFVVLLDLLIIIIFSFILDTTSKKIGFVNDVLLFFSDNKILLPLVVILRFVFVYLDRMNLEVLKLNIQVNLRNYFIKEVFDKGNYSVSDAFFYINTLSVHVSTFYGSLAAVISFFAQIVVFIMYLLYSNTEVISVFGFGILILYFPTRYFIKMLRKYSHLSYESLQEINKNVEKVLDNLYLIKILNKIKFEINEYIKTQNKFFNSQVMNLKFGTLNSILPNLITLLILSIIIAFFDVSNFLTIEFIGVLLRLFQTLGNFNRSISITTNSHVHLEMLHNIDKNKGMSNVQNFKTNFDKNEIEGKKYAIKFKSVGFQYFNSQENIFSNLNLEIEKNSHVVITGQNGSGKSTLLGLLSGVFYPTEGKVECYSKKIAYVGAKPMILNSSLRDNLIYGCEEKVEDLILEDYLKKFKVFNNSSNTNLLFEVSNKSLSSGQMQKISFIRALIMNPDTLILDESTANLDLESKELIFNILKNLNLTIVNSTHNIESLATYDKHYGIVKTEKGSDLILY